LLFRKKKIADPDSLLQDAWRTDFRLLERKRFTNEVGRDFISKSRKRRLELKIHKSSCFAWVLTPYQYRDFTIQAQPHIGRENGHSAVGFVFRYNNEDNFYYFLLSNRGRFRFDVVFNRNPIHLIEWTDLPAEVKDPSVRDPAELRIIARDHDFSFFLGDEWLAEASDDTLKTGYVGFAAQNYEEENKAVFFLNSLSIEARPVQVEQEFLRWNRYVPVSPRSRINLAQTYTDMGKHSEAVVQLKAALEHLSDSAELHLLLARAYIQLKAYPESLSCLDRLLELEPENDQVRLEKADVLFLEGEFLSCRDHIESILPRYPRDPQLRNLLGRCQYNLGKWENAAEQYREAIELDADNAVYRVNLARCMERAGDSSGAVENYFKAARQLFRQEIYDELSLVLARLNDLLPPDSDEAYELKSFEAKMLFHEGKKHQAENIFSEVIDSGYSDSGVHYLYGLMLAEKQDRAAAEVHLRKATEIDPDYPLYWFRLAENRFLLGEDPWQALDRAYALDPEDPWINNLKGQVLMGASRHAEALPCFEKALASEAGATSIHGNFAECLMRLGRGEEALQVLEAGTQRIEASSDEQSKEELASLHNQRGNCLVRLQRCTEAVGDYEKALELVPGNRDYMQNCAACCIELDMIMRAEELLNNLLEEQESAILYNLTGNLAVVTGELERARLAYLEGLKLEEDNREIKLNLLCLYIQTDKVEEARKLLAEMEGWENPPERYEQLQDRFRERFEELLECAGCGRQWRVPKRLPPQPSFTIRGEPPGEAPAGRCERCKRLYCIACASEWVEDGRLMCPECHTRLRLNDDSVKYLMLQYIDD
jgi:tetratricopeptide (TPR) repeat protein